MRLRENKNKKERNLWSVKISCNSRKQNNKIEKKSSELKEKREKEK